MELINMGDMVQVLEPFTEFTPNIYEVISVSEDEDRTCSIDVDGQPRDFASKFLQKVEV